MIESEVNNSCSICVSWRQNVSRCNKSVLSLSWVEFRVFLNKTRKIFQSNDREKKDQTSDSVTRLRKEYTTRKINHLSQMSDIRAIHILLNLFDIPSLLYSINRTNFSSFTGINSTAPFLRIKKVNIKKQPSNGHIHWKQNDLTVSRSTMNFKWAKQQNFSY